MQKRVRRAIALAVPAATAFFTEELYRYIFCRHSSALFDRLCDHKNGHSEAYYHFRSNASKHLQDLAAEEFTITSPRGEPLKGYYYACGANGRKIAFILHGYRSNHADTAGMVYDYYLSRGIDVFCCDHTTTGESGGEFIGFDVLETQDCLAWLDFLRDKFGPDAQILLHGFSMGASTVLQMSSHCTDNVKFLISDSAYQNARASLDHQIGPLYQPLRQINRMVAGYDWDDSDVTNSLAACTLPILFVHGRDDKLVPFENGPALYNFYQGEKDYFFPEDTRHIESFYTSPQEYGEKIDCFLERYFQNQ